MYLNSEILIKEKYKKRGNQKIVFLNRFGEIRSYQSLQKGFRRFLNENGLEHEHITFHMFRHTYATLLQDARVDINIIRDLLGHSDIQTTANIYVKVNNEPKRMAALLLKDTINDLMPGI